MRKRLNHLVITIGCFFILAWPAVLIAEGGGGLLSGTETVGSTSVETAAKGDTDAEQAEIQWYSYENGIEQIKKGNKKGFLHFYTDWCAYCKIMNKQTFADADVIDYMNTYFIPIRINAEEKKNIAQKYGVYRFPSNWFLGEDAENIANHPGYIPPTMMIQILKYINTDSYQSLQFQEYLDQEGM